MRHTTSTVFAFVKEFIPHLKVILPNIKHIHYYTDSPTSQYRKETIFYLLSRHKDLFDVTTFWNYFDSAGHCIFYGMLQNSNATPGKWDIPCHTQGSIA